MDTDVAIIGAGPAGLQAAIHSARKKVDTIVIGKPRNSAIHGTEFENYVGLPNIMSGTDFLMNGIEQVRSFGGRLLEQNVLSLSRDGERFRISLEDGDEVIAKALVLATGTTRVKLGVPGESKFANGKGVSYCAVCDCNFYRGKVVALVGGQSEAVVDAEFMTRYASKVYLISPRFDTDAKLLDAAEKAGVTRVEAAVEEILGETRVTSVRLSNGDVLELDGVFIELGGKSSVDLAMELDIMPEMDDSLKVDRGCATAVAGVFACGDITGKPWQVAKAVGEGCIAGMAAADHARKVSE
ncbi:MAG: FAD-dependent oxidoreductase [archaeon]|nr:FAD-dependent oxidoreductase [archaeon]